MGTIKSVSQEKATSLNRSYPNLTVTQQIPFRIRLQITRALQLRRHGTVTGSTLR